MPESEIVVYKRDKPEVSKRIDPKLLELIVLDDIQVALSKVNRHLKKEEFEGVLVPLTLSATDEIRDIAPLFTPPDIPWISAYFINDGPDLVGIAINYPDDRFTIKPNETITVNRSGAQERIAVIFYACERGKTATVRITGEY